MAFDMSWLINQLSEFVVNDKSQKSSEECDAAESVSQSMSGRLKSPMAIMSLQGGAARLDR